MEAGRIGGVQRGALVVVHEPAVARAVGAPVQRAAHDLAAALRERVVVAPALHDVDLAARGPRAVRAVGGEHPDSGPEPVAGGKACLDLDAAVLDTGAGAGRQAGGACGVDDRAVGGVGVRDAGGQLVGRAGVRGGEVDGRIVGGDEGGILQRWLDVEPGAVDVSVFGERGRLVELAVAGCCALAT